MDANSITQLISAVGFPIVACLGLGYFIYQAFQKIMGQNEVREEKLYTILGQAQTTNRELTETNAKFVEVLRSYQTDLDEIKSDVSDIKDVLEKG